MKRSAFPGLALVACSILFWGCPDTFEFPLAPPKMPADPAYLGNWQDVATGERYEVKSLSSTRYTIRFESTSMSQNVGGGKVLEVNISETPSDSIVPDTLGRVESNSNSIPIFTVLTGHLCEYNNQLFLNVGMNDNSTWYIFKLTKQGEDLILHPLTNRGDFRFNSSKKVQGYFDNYHSNRYFYDTPIHLVRP